MLKIYIKIGTHPIALMILKGNIKPDIGDSVQVKTFNHGSKWQSVTIDKRSLSHNMDRLYFGYLD